MFEQLTDRWWCAGGERSPIRLSTENSHQRVGDCLSTRKRLKVGEHLVQDAAERPYIAPLVRGPASCLLWAHVRGGAQNYSHPRHRRAADGRRRRRISARRNRRLQYFREPKVQNLHRAIRSHLDVRWLQIAVNDPLLMGGFERIGNLTCHGHRVVNWQRPGLQSLGERLALDKFEDQKLCSGGFLEAVDGRDVWMVQRGEHARFAPEACDAIGIVG